MPRLRITIEISKRALLSFALASLGCTRAPSEPRPSAPSQPQAAASQPDDVDAQDQDVIAQIRSAGADPSKPMELTHYLYVPAHSDALKVSESLTKSGYRVEIREPLGRLPDGTVERRWSVLAHVRAAPTIENIRQARGMFLLLARACGAEYDGWDADLRPPGAKP